MNETADYDSYIAGLEKENATNFTNWQAAAAENRRLAGIEQDRDAYKQLLGSLLVYAKTGRIAGHQLSEQEQATLFAECERALENNSVDELAKRVIKTQAEHIEMMAAAYLQKTQLDPRETELVQEYRGTQIIWYFRKRNT